MSYDSVKIVDISQFQGKINWKLLKTRAHAVIMRSSYGMNTDPTFVTNRDACRAEGICFGTYHFCNPDGNAVNQARYYATLATGDLLPVMDCEYAGAASASLVSSAAMMGSYNMSMANGAHQQEPAASAYGLTKSQLISWYEKFINEFKAIIGKKPIIYTSAGFWNFTAGWEKDCKLWVANYTSAAEPMMPVAWKPKENPDKYPWRLWQWSADGNNKGAEYGVSSRDLDLDRYHGTLAEFNAEFGVNVQPLPTPEPPPPPPSVGEYQVIANSWANLRSSPEDLKAANDIGNLVKGSTFKPVGASGDWYEIHGYVAKSTVKKIG